MGNKIKYGLKNVYRAKITEDEEGGITYGTPTAIKGAVSISVSPDITTTDIAADDEPKYATMVEDNGYTGDIEFQNLTDQDRVDLFGSKINDDGVLIENKEDKPNATALLFEFDGDANKTRHILYNCLCTKPSVESETGKSNKTDKCSFTARPALDTGYIKAKVENDKTGKTKYDAWFTKVYLPSGE